MACAPKKHFLHLDKEIQHISQTQLKNGHSTISLIPYRKAVLKKDAFNIGFVTTEKSEGTLLKFEYIKQVPEHLADADYSEVVYINLQKDFSEINSNNPTATDSQILFGRFCYCKGQTGFYTVKNGDLLAKMITKNRLKIALKFHLKQVPHLISNIQEDIHLK